MTLADGESPSRMLESENSTSPLGVTSGDDFARALQWTRNVQPRADRQPGSRQQTGSSFSGQRSAACDPYTPEEMPGECRTKPTATMGENLPTPDKASGGENSYTLGSKKRRDVFRAVFPSERTGESCRFHQEKKELHRNCTAMDTDLIYSPDRGGIIERKLLKKSTAKRKFSGRDYKAEFYDRLRNPHQRARGSRGMCK